MKDNLDLYFNGDSRPAKKDWFNANRIADLTKVGCKILTSYRRFVCSLCSSVLNLNEMQKLGKSVLHELTIYSALNPYESKAYEIALFIESN